VGLNSLKSLNLTNGYPNKNNKNKNNNNNNKVKSKPLELRSRVKNIVFTSGDGKNHEWRRPRVVFGVPTSENNVFALLKQAQ
jgi:hypothetical protein